MKLRIVQQQEQANEMKDEEMELEPVMRVSPEEDSSPMPDEVGVSGKRKRQEKLAIDVYTPIAKFKNKKSSASKSKDGTGMLENGRALTSNGDGIVCALSTPAQSKSPTLIRAEQLLFSLGNDHPRFLKVMVRSHVGSCFWMGLPMSFCKKHLPNDDVAVLENENGEEFAMKYIAHKPGLSAGWRKFVAGNKLLEGDVLVFQLTGPCRFKVYIIRSNDLNEVDGALGLLILDSQTKQSDAEGTNDATMKKKRQQKSLPLAILPTHAEEQIYPQPGQPDEHSGNNSEGVASEVLECYKFSESSIQFKDVKSFEEFHIVVDGICIDPELPEDVRQIYYELCLSKHDFLHSHILPGLYSKLASAVIFEIVAIAESIKSSKPTTPVYEFEVWDQSLRSFEVLGLNVEFLRTRLQRLRDLALDSEAAADTNKYQVAKTGRCQVENEICALEEKLAELRELKCTFDQEVESLKVKAETQELKFQEEANAPW